MKYLLAFLPILAIVFIACSSDTPSDKAVAATADAKPDGEKLYKINCVQCHGLYGNMGASGAANLVESKLSLDERILVITNGRNVMMPFKSLLDEKEIKAVAKYTLKLSKDS